VNTIEFSKKMAAIRKLMNIDPNGEDAIIASKLHSKIKELCEELPGKHWLFDVVYDAIEGDPSGLFTNTDPDSFLGHAGML
jgi:hypothetical protein